MLEDLKPLKRPCKVARYIIELGETDGLILAQAINAPKWSNLGLAKALTAKGLNISEGTIRNHRADRCACKGL